MGCNEWLIAKSCGSPAPPRRGPVRLVFIDAWEVLCEVGSQMLGELAIAYGSDTCDLPVPSASGNASAAGRAGLRTPPSNPVGRVDGLLIRSVEQGAGSYMCALPPTLMRRGGDGG